MITTNPLTQSTSTYACPACRTILRRRTRMLRCPSCLQSYPVTDDIPDFMGIELSHSADPALRRMHFADKVAGIYETRLWYPLVLKLLGGMAGPSLSRLIDMVVDRVRPVNGRVLDIACGPGTFGRRIASSSKEVWGIDVSTGMLRQGAAYCAREGNPYVHFARARAESLPFGDALFDAAICCGSLHAFSDTAVALFEMARVMKPGAALAVYTLTAGRGGILKYRCVREWSRRNHGLRVFALSEMKNYLIAAGFDDIRPEIHGSILIFSARKA
jgi:SAM-dependent methyltransferase